MKIKFSFIITFLFIICILVPSKAQKQDCIICPEMLGIITSTENGVNISTLTPSQNSVIIVSSEAEKNSKTKPYKKTSRKKEKLGIKANDQKKISRGTGEEVIMGFATSDNSTEENLEDCGCDGTKTNTEITEETIEVFTLYPNPAHHWVVINSKITADGNYKLFLKDSQGRIIKEREVSENSTKLDLRSLKQGVYFVTLRNEEDFTTTVKKVTVK